MRIGPTFREGRIRWIRAKFEGNPYREMMVLKTKFDTRFSICCFLLFLNTSKHPWIHVLCKEFFENSRQFCIAFEVGPIRIYATVTAFGDPLGAFPIGEALGAALAAGFFGMVCLEIYC